MNGSDMLTRLRAVLPTRWFPDEAPILDSLLVGLGWTWDWLRQSLDYVAAQSRVSTSTDIWLDVLANDYFGGRLRRRVGQGDDMFRGQIQRELLRERGTRNALISALEDLTGRRPIIFEPARTEDTGGYGTLLSGGVGAGYNTAGGWGSLSLPFQAFVTAYRPLGAGISVVAGWGIPAGGYGIGCLEYASLTMVQGQVTDDDIYSTVAEVVPIATTGWVRISN